MISCIFILIWLHIITTQHNTTQQHGNIGRASCNVCMMRRGWTKCWYPVVARWCCWTSCCPSSRGKDTRYVSYLSFTSLLLSFFVPSFLCLFASLSPLILFILISSSFLFLFFLTSFQFFTFSLPFLSSPYLSCPSDIFLSSGVDIFSLFFLSSFITSYPFLSLFFILFRLPFLSQSLFLPLSYLQVLFLLIYHPFFVSVFNLSLPYLPFILSHHFLFSCPIFLSFAPFFHL